MKKLVLLLGVAILSCKSPIKQEQAIQTLKEFYTAYLSERSKFPEDTKKIDSLKNKYLTEELRTKLLNFDYDLIVNAQDCDKTWINTLSISKDDATDSIYNVCYTDNIYEKCVKIILVNCKGEYLINNILCPSNQESEIVNIIKSDDITGFNKYITNFNNIDTILDADEGFSLLGYSCMYGSINITKRLIELKANIEMGQESDVYSYDALYVAVLNNNLEIVKILLDSGANPNSIYDENGLTPLVVSCAINNYDISKLLIDYNANVDGAGDLEGDYIYYPLFEAIQNDNFNMVKLLLDKGAKKDIINKQGASISDLLVDKDKNIVELFAK